MPRGQPDYGLYTDTPVASGISDPGEAAARLGSINVYDRRGWTVWMDDFEAPGLKWIPNASVGGTNPVLSTLQAWMGLQSAFFTTAAVAGAYAQIIRRFPLVRLGRIGIEFFLYLTVRTPGYFRVIWPLLDGTNESQAELRLDNEARTATIVTPAGNIVVATSCFPTPPVHVWIPVKLVVDLDTDRYVRLLIGPDEIDLSAHSLMNVGATTEKYFYLAFRLVGGVGGGGTAYQGNFILTQNEP